jgi:DNA-binding beta-propeller fold protein YncE
VSRTPTARRFLTPLAAGAALCALAGCGGSAAGGREPALAAVRTAPGATAGAPVASASAGATAPEATAPAAATVARARRHADPEALVTAETVDRLDVVDLRTARVVASLPMPAGPQYVAAAPSGAAIVTSPQAGTVTLLQGRRLRRRFTGLGAPDIVAVAPDGAHAYIADGARGTLTVLTLARRITMRSIHVGAGAHHMTFSPDGRRLWIALGEQARTIAILDTTDVLAPRVIARLDPGFLAHDLAFSPDGRRVWVSAADGASVAVFRAADHRLLFRVPVGPPPQHIAFAGRYAYLTSGYGSVIEQVLVANGRVLRRARVPYGSFELDVAGGYAATASLLDGKLAILTPDLRLLRVLPVAPATRDVAIALR